MPIILTALAAIVLLVPYFFVYFIAPAMNMHLMENTEAILKQKIYNEIYRLRTDPQRLMSRIRQGDSYFNVGGINILENNISFDTRNYGQYMRIVVPYQFTNLFYNDRLTNEQNRIQDRQKNMVFLVDKVQ